MKAKYKVLLSFCVALILFGSFYFFNHKKEVVEYVRKAPEKVHFEHQEQEDAVDELEIIEKPVEKLLKHKLNVKQSIQENAYYCVPAGLQMVLDYKGIQKTQSDLATEMNTSSKTGTEYVDLARVANKYIFNLDTVSENGAGYRVQTLSIGHMSTDQKAVLNQRLKQNIDDDYPSFVAIDNKAMYETLSVGNHMIVIIGYNLNTVSGEVESYIFIDPSYVVQDDVYGGLKVVSVEDLYEAIYLNEEPAYVY